MTPQQAVAATLKRLEGAFALAIIFAGRHDLMIGARRGSAARRRLWRRRDVPGLRRAGAGAAHRSHLLPGGGRLGELSRTGARCTTPKTARSSAGEADRVVRRHDRQGRVPPFHAEGNLRATGVSSATRLQTLLNPLNRNVDAARSRHRPLAIPRLTISACGTAYYAGMVAKYWFEQVARLPVEVDIASEFRYREAPMPDGGAASSSRSPARPSTPWRRCATPRAAARRSSRWSTSPRAHRARVRRHPADPGRPGDRRRLHQGLHHPADGAGLPGAGHRAGARRHRRGREAELSQALMEVPARSPRC
jgi:hypothetical protein